MGYRAAANGVRGMKISAVNTCLIAFAGLICLALLGDTFFIRQTYEELADTAADYVILERKAREVREASDYLTEQARLYVQTGDPRYAELYFEEANVTRRRDVALATMEEYSLAGSHGENMEAAVLGSKKLMLRELYAMRLVAEGSGSDLADLPPEVRGTRLEPEDAALPPEEKIDKGRLLMFDEAYQRDKAEIYGYLDAFIEAVLGAQEDRVEDGLNRLSRMIRTQRVLLVVLSAVFALLFAATAFLVIRPLRGFLRCVQEKKPLEMRGAYEFKYLASVYNAIYRHNEVIVANERFLRHKAEHDALTGLLNRGEFNRVSGLLEESSVPLALMLVDVDRFKQVNDTYGHPVGDRLLKRIAALLRDNFRSQDYLFRLGGDEFACIVTDLTREQAAVVVEKVRRISESLKGGEEALPPVSLSVGVAFSPEGYQEDLYQQADTALYQVKAQGRDGCAVYAGTQAEPAGAARPE